MINEIRKKNPIFEVLERYPWLGELKHDLPNYNDHLLELNRIFNQQLYRQMVGHVTFSPSILEKYEE
jgi:hypothetical protein